MSGTSPPSRVGRDEGTSEARWEKVLWKRQPFEDNYVPPSFLSELDRLGELGSNRLITAVRPRPRLFSLAIAALPITQHLAAIALLVAVFYRLLVHDVGAAQVGWTVTGASLIGWALMQYGWSRGRSL